MGECIKANVFLFYKKQVYKKQLRNTGKPSFESLKNLLLRENFLLNWKQNTNNIRLSNVFYLNFDFPSHSCLIAIGNFKD